MYLLELVSEDGNIVAEKFNKQVEIVNKYQFSEKSIRNSVKSGNFIKSKNVSYKVSELDDNDVGDIVNNMPLSEHMTPSYEKEGEYTIGKDNVFEGKVERVIDKDRDVYTAVLLGDEHFCYEDKPSIQIVYQFIEKHKDEIQEIMFGGDGIDASSLGKHLNLESEKHDLYKEMETFKNYANNIKLIVPNAKFSIVEDNHYHLRKARFIAENPAMRNMIKEIKFEFDEITKHGKPYFPLHEYGNNIIAGIHGIYFNDVFTKNNTVNYSMDLFQFHTHTIQTYKGNNGVTSYGIPCLCKKEMAYLQGKPTRWDNGFGILKYFPKQNRYSIDYCIIKDGIGIYKDEVYKDE